MKFIATVCVAVLVGCVVYICYLQHEEDARRVSNALQAVDRDIGAANWGTIEGFCKLPPGTELVLGACVCRVNAQGVKECAIEPGDPVTNTIELPSLSR